ncbi:MAG: SoxR reducing system RseC family protein [Candidatus Subteraquimicrobiales bacterium]|nr:SoxR reducing system RseC family protein [Candidatus Subteraquimicrobiales bacterium]
MQETGLVVKVKGNMAEVQMKRSPACEACGVCRLLSDEVVITEAINQAGAEADDEVLLELASQSVLKATLIVFGIPLLFLIAGYLIGYSLARFLNLGFSQTLGVVFAFLFVGLSYLVIREIDKRISVTGRYQPVIKEIVKKGGH